MYLFKTYAVTLLFEHVQENGRATYSPICLKFRDKVNKTHPVNSQPCRQRTSKRQHLGQLTNAAADNHEPCGKMYLKQCGDGTQSQSKAHTIILKVTWSRGGEFGESFKAVTRRKLPTVVDQHEGRLH